MMDAVNILGIDPGSRLLGTAILTISEGTVTAIKAETLNFDVLKYEYPDYYREGLPNDRILVLTDSLRRRLKACKINSIFIESPFINPKRISAFKPLVELNSKIIEIIVNEFGRQIPVTFLSPITIKKQMKTKGLDKDSMKAAMLSNQFVEQFSDLLNACDEHSIDATAAAISGYELFK